MINNFMIDNFSFTWDKVDKEGIKSEINRRLEEKEIYDYKVINIQIIDVTATLYQIWVWYRS